ncbi:MAG: SAM-dependent DNA methyltransferase [Nitrososphaerota archaeon]|nr:SAM-dependent DNA methyltransferase [Nitrososphaerota archaeon]
MSVPATGSQNVVTTERQVISRERVSNHGEVLTGKREVNAMLDLVTHETKRIESRFLEPACGTGNFLTVILERKLEVVERRYGKSQLDFERYAVVAVSSVYGIDILADNVSQCCERLFGVFDGFYERLFPQTSRAGCREAVRFILARNIVWGDALDLKTCKEPRRPIVFSEWSLINGSMLKRRDFMLSFLLEKYHQTVLISDEGNVADLNKPVKEFSPVHFMEIARDQQ